MEYGIALVAFVRIALVGYEYYNSIPQEDPIAGWQEVFSNLDSDVLIYNDYHQFVNELPAIDKQTALGPFCFTDGTGQGDSNSLDSLVGSVAFFKIVNQYAF